MHLQEKTKLNKFKRIQAGFKPAKLLLVQSALVRVPHLSPIQSPHCRTKAKANASTAKSLEHVSLPGRDRHTGYTQKTLSYRE